MFNNRIYFGGGLLGITINDFDETSKLIDFLVEAKKDGYDKIEPIRVEPFRILSEKEIIEEELKHLNYRVEELKKKLKII